MTKKNERRDFIRKVSLTSLGLDGKRRAAAFAEAKIDTAIIFGWHIRFDYANYFGHLHGRIADVANELHKYDIKIMDHYSCNHTERYYRQSWIK